jgi:hypothetical protein
VCRHGMCFRVSSVFVLSILFWFPQSTHYFWRVFRFLFMEHKQDYSWNLQKMLQYMKNIWSRDSCVVVSWCQTSHTFIWTSPCLFTSSAHDTHSWIFNFKRVEIWTLNIKVYKTVCVVTVCVFVCHLFSFYPFYFDFHSARIIDMHFI